MVAVSTDILNQKATRTLKPSPRMLLPPGEDDGVSAYDLFNGTKILNNPESTEIKLTLLGDAISMQQNLSN